MLLWVLLSCRKLSLWQSAVLPVMTKLVSWCSQCHFFTRQWKHDEGLQLHQPRLSFITGGYLVKRWFLPAAARGRGQSNDLNREILASNLFNCCKEVINAPPVPSISRCIHIVYRQKNVWEYQWSNFIYNCMSTFLHYVRCKDAPLDCSAPGGERCESLTGVDEIIHPLCRKVVWSLVFLHQAPWKVIRFSWDVVSSLSTQPAKRKAWSC